MMTFHAVMAGAMLIAAGFNAANGNWPAAAASFAAAVFALNVVGLYSRNDLR